MIMLHIIWKTLLIFLLAFGCRWLWGVNLLIGIALFEDKPDMPIREGIYYCFLYLVCIGVMIGFVTGVVAIVKM